MNNLMINTFKIVVPAIIISGCTINKYENKVKVGKWVDKYNVEGIAYKNVEFYKKGIERGTWKSYVGNKLSSKEKYRNDTCYVKNYYPNGKINSFGKSVILRNDKDNLHWFYVGEWKYFDEKGSLNLIRIYKNGLETKEIPIKDK
jgi:hypothetical protein